MCSQDRFSPYPRVLALTHKWFDGDNALLELAALRLREGGLGTEFYAENPGELEWLFTFRPTPDSPAMVHLPRWIDLFDEKSRGLVLDFARSFAGRIQGFIVHDQVQIKTRLEEYVSILEKLESGLSGIKCTPHLFIEYASGLSPDLFVTLFERINHLRCMGPCVDTGHFGLRYVENAFHRLHSGSNVFALSCQDPCLPDLVEDLQSAVSSALPGVLEVLKALAHPEKAIHFHLHDGHPLSPFSNAGVSDHLSFLTRIPIPFSYRGRWALDQMFGLAGLSTMLGAAYELFGPERLTINLEIHPYGGRLPLRHASYLFEHWEDKGNAERMNHWLSVLIENHQLVRHIPRLSRNRSVSNE